MTDQEILDKYRDLEGSCLTKEEKKEVMMMLYKYKEAFSLRDGDRHMPQHRGSNRCHGQIPIFYKALPCKRGGQSFIQQRDEKITLSRYIEGRFFTLFQPSNVN